MSAIALMRAIHDNPTDYLPRLAYADWLEEQGEVEHAEFIRVELALAKLSRDDVRWRPVFQRELALIRAHKDEWFGRFRDSWFHYELRRGFIEEIAARTAAGVVPHADWLLAHHALQYLWARDDWPALRPLLHHPLAAVLARLGLNGPQLNYFAGATLSHGSDFDVPLARRPLFLSLTSHHAGPEIVDDLLLSPHLGRLTALELSDNRIGPEGLQRLLDGLGRFPRLEVLSLRGRTGEGNSAHVPVHVPNVDCEGIRLLANHPASAGLKYVDLSFNRLDMRCAEALILSPFLRDIQKLVLGQTARRAIAERLRRHFHERVDVAPA
jgi:uncharacterized protein (TIGR02996 family)